MSNLKIIFFGTPKIGSVVLEALIGTGFEIPLVITRASKPIGRKKIITPTPVKQVALKHNIPILIPAKLKDNPELISKLKALSSDLIIVAAYGKIIPNEILKLPEYGVINIHPSLLPKYRGAAPIHFPILRGEEKTGVTIIKMSEGLDEGDIISQAEIPIEKDDTTESMTEKLSTLAAKLLIETIPAYVAWRESKSTPDLTTGVKPDHQRDTRGVYLFFDADKTGIKTQLFLPPKPQDHTKATYTAMLSKESGRIDLNNPPDPKTFDQMVRAFFPWPTVWSRLTVNSKQLTVKFLPGNLIQPEGKKPMSVKEFLNGHPEVRQLLEQLDLK